MFTFGFFTTNIPYILIALSSLFYFVTTMVDKDLADKWFSVEGGIEVQADDAFATVDDCADYCMVACLEPLQEQYKAFAVRQSLIPIGQPQAVVVAREPSQPSLPRPPTA